MHPGVVFKYALEIDSAISETLFSITKVWAKSQLPIEIYER